MRDLLHLFPKPSHYAGLEAGIVLKPRGEVRLRVALAYPDTYEVGMSYLGQKILYSIINNTPGWQAERVFAPEKEAAALLKAKKTPLATLETDTPLEKMDAVGFSITHELCFTDVLHMLDLANIPLRHENRPDSLSECPLIIAGGGAMLGAEPVVPFFDLVCLGDGEELLPEVLTLLEQAKTNKTGRKEFLRQAAAIPGVYVPSLFEMLPDSTLKPLVPDYRPGRRIVADLDKTPYPVSQVTPVGAVQNRLTLEIARGCTRGCRFCHAGMLYRPCRERSPENLDSLLAEGLAETGFEEVSFLSLSAGDYSALRTLFDNAWSRCAEEQVTLSLPSLRVGSVDNSIMERIASLRRTGCTLAPEAGSQRLRDIINKGITEEQLLEHAGRLLEHGWRQVKLYFMIGLPEETDADLDAILDLCRKTRDAGGKGAPKLAVTASISPFVPKPFTPFQWEAQIGLTEMRRRIDYCRDIFRRQKNITLRWHAPDSSHLEGLLSRADRRMANVVEKAYKNGAIFCGWAEHFSLEPWLAALEECGLDAEELIGPRDPAAPLPWDHLESGISKAYLEKERVAAHQGKTTPDCRYGACGQCGACDIGKKQSLLPRVKTENRYGHKLVFQKRDQRETGGYIPPPPQRQTRPQLAAAVLPRQSHYRIWHAKLGCFAFLSQLELQALLYRVLRRAKLPVAYSRGFHPLPLLSFGRALPVSVASEVEWFGLTLSTHISPQRLAMRLNGFLPEELEVWQVEMVEKSKKTEQAHSEAFELAPAEPEQAAMAFEKFSQSRACPITRETKKGAATVDVRPLLAEWQLLARPNQTPRLRFTTDWTAGYLSPLTLVKAIFSPFGELAESGINLVKTRQSFADGRVYIRKNHSIKE